MGWSKAGPGKLSKLRAYRSNGGKLSGRDMKSKKRQEDISKKR